MKVITVLLFAAALSGAALGVEVAWHDFPIKKYCNSHPANKATEDCKSYCEKMAKKKCNQIQTMAQDLSKGNCWYGWAQTADGDSCSYCTCKSKVTK